MAAAEAPSGTIIRELNFAGARTAADPATRGISGPLKAASKKLKTSVADRRDADDGTLDASALFDYALQVVEEGVLALHYSFTGLYKTNKHSEIARVFGKKPPKSLIAAIGKERALEVYGELSKQANDRRTDPKLKDAVKAFTALFNNLTTAKAGVVAAGDAFDLAGDEEAKAKKAGFIALRKTRGQLTDKFPEDLKRVSRYFLRTGKKGGGASTTTAPAPQPEPAAA